MDEATPRHLVTVWNPTYAADALDEHVRLLLSWSERHRRREAGEGEVYVWWAKLRSPSRTQALPHLAEILAIDAQAESEIETHLYLTDYRSLYVAELLEVTEDPIGDHAEETAHVPPYIRGHVAELWFKLADIRRLASDDTLAVIEELRHLRNTRYHDKPVSLYGGIVEPPLIVTRDREVSWFESASLLTGGRLWAERDAELRGEVERLGRELRENLFGLEVWSTFEPGTRSFAATGEAVYRLRGDDPAFDLSTALVEYAKALETELNALIFPVAARALARQSPADRTARVDGRPLDLAGRVPHQTLGAIASLLEHDEALRRGLKLGLPHDWKWLCGELPHQLTPVLDVRNPGAHSQTSSREAVRPVRCLVLGIGSEGLLVRIARVRLRAQA